MKPKHNWQKEVDNIYNMGIEGKTLKQIGDFYDVSSVYIKKLIIKFNIFNNVDYGAKARAKNKKEDKNKKLFLKYGENDGSELYKAKRRKFITKQSNMKRAGIEFNINFGDIDFPEYCPILEIKLDYFAEGKSNDNSPSFDRIDSNKGYVTDNVRVISNKANRIKSDGDIETLKKIIEYLETKNFKINE